MSRTFRIAVLLAGLSVVTSAAAQTSETATTKTKTTKKSGVVETVYGNHVVLKDADGTHEWTVPEDFQFQMNGQNLTVANLQPGMKVEATTTEKTTVRDVIVTKNVTGQVAQVAPGGIVVRDSSGRLTSFRAQDVEGKDLTILRPGRETPTRPQELSWRQLRVGDRLEATIVTTFPPKVVTKTTTSATVKPQDAVGGAGPAEQAPTPPPEPAAK